MAAQFIGIYTIDFPDPSTITYKNKNFNTVNDSLAFTYRIASNFQTLSTKGAGDSDPFGILYVPDLSSDGCKSGEAPYVAANATRLANIPSGQNYALIAVAPWFSAQCTLEYFAAARLVPTKAVLVYQPGRGNDIPPMLNDPSWSLNDGGRWQQANTFPTYALSSMTGAIVMHQLALYSGNLTDAPHGSELAQVYRRSDYIRLWATVNTDQGAQLPSLWVFLVIVLAILLLAVSGTSVAMHIIQRRRRIELHQRVLRGEIDLEALGVKRLHVDQPTLDKLPVYTYTASDHEDAVPRLPPPAADPPSAVDGETGANMPPLALHSSAPTTASAPASSLSQPTCPICLDDFEPDKTQVRELPCRHIFHPDCIDTFLLRNSSLCPMCKQSVLPPGACPVKITNMMVRRERHIARMRARSRVSSHPANGLHATSPLPSQPHTAPSRSLGILGWRLWGTSAGRRIPSAPDVTPPRPANIEMANNDTATAMSATISSPTPADGAPHLPSATPNPPNCAPTQNRREWARQRALQMLGNHDDPISDVEEPRSPRWRQILHKVFPGFR